jgi:hypothetical protein
MVPGYFGRNYTGYSPSFEWLQPAYSNINVNSDQINRDGALAVSWSESI